MVRVKFLKSPTGKFNLAYNAGEFGFVPEQLAQQLYQENYAEAAPENTVKAKEEVVNEQEKTTKATAVSKRKTEKR